MPDKVSEEIIYARLEEIRRLAELIRDAHHDCVFNVKGGGKRSSGCLIPEITPNLGPACGEPARQYPRKYLMPFGIWRVVSKIWSSILPSFINLTSANPIDDEGGYKESPIADPKKGL